MDDTYLGRRWCRFRDSSEKTLCMKMKVSKSKESQPLLDQHQATSAGWEPMTNYEVKPAVRMQLSFDNSLLSTHEMDPK